MKAIWNDTIIAESDDIVVVEGNSYFPIGALRTEHVEPSAESSVCGWKGTASYYDVVVDGEVIAGGAWYYPDPKDAAAEIRDRVAFWRGVQVVA